MPYIANNLREQLTHRTPGTEGELAYEITTVLLDYVATKGLSFKTINDITGVLINVGLEFNRRVTVPYEEQKIKENGDVYGPLDGGYDPHV